MAGDDAGDGLAATPDPEYKWVGAFPSYTATEVSGQLPAQLGNQGATVFAPPAVATDGSFVTYEFAPAHAVLRPQQSGLSAEPGQPDQLGLVTSLTYVTGGYVATTGQPETLTFATGVSTTSVATFATDVEFVNDPYAPIPTAIAFDGSRAYVFASARTGPYGLRTSKALTGSAEEIPAMASQLADAGFVITAFGQLDDAPTYGLVGLDSPPAGKIARDAVVTQIVPGNGSGSATALFAAGYVPVGGYVSNGATYFIFEK